MTQIFNSFAEFNAREDRLINGVSNEFAQANSNWEAMNESNVGCWNCRSCSSCSSCSYCSYCSYCSSCSSCRYCSSCGDCRDCRDCRDCSYCSYISRKSRETKSFTVPTIPNIHAAVLEAVSKEGALEMGSWHTCDTTHCRAGWVVWLAGDAGRELERLTDTPFAAMMIYKDSSPIKVPLSRFFEDNETAMKDIVRCAEEEVK